MIDASPDRRASSPDVPATMIAPTARQYGGAEEISLEEVPVPRPAKGEVLVRVAASSLNALDWHFLTGTPYMIRLMAGLRRPRRTTPGADLAGTVVDIGANVHTIAVGDEVFGECLGGACAPFATIKAKNLVPKPTEVSFEAAGATPVAGLTAVQALRTHANVQPGDRVLVNGAAGGVGTFCVQVAKALGAEVAGVCGGRNVEMLRALGADDVIDYTSTDFVVGGQRFDVMVDNVGNRTPTECLSVLNPGGRYVAVSGPKDNMWLGPVPFMTKTALKFLRSDASFHHFTAAPSRKDLTFLGELLATGQISPAIDRVIGLEDVAAGMAEIGSGHARAKIAVAP